jgi:hypothetical protein
VKENNLENTLSEGPNTVNSSQNVVQCKGGGPLRNSTGQKCVNTLVFMSNHKDVMADTPRFDQKVIK